MFPDEHSPWPPSRFSRDEARTSHCFQPGETTRRFMRPCDRFVTLAFVTFTAAALMGNRPARAAAVASDNACNTPYGGTNWSNGQNGGTGFGAWSLFDTGGGTFTFFTGSSGINGSCGEA